MFVGMSGHRMSFTFARTSPGESVWPATDRITDRVAAITSAAGTPLSVTSPMTIPRRPPDSSMKS